MKKFLMIGFLLVSFFAMWAMASPCIAEKKFPTKPITLIIGFGPGGGTDSTLRYLAESVSKRLGQPVVPVNKPGGGGTIALGELKSDNPDGYTLCFLAFGGVASPHMRKLPYHPVKDFDPIIQYADCGYGLVVRADSPFKTLNDFVTYARANPGKVTYSTSGVGTLQHLAMVQLGDLEKVRWTLIPYKSSTEAITALLGGHVTAAAQGTEWKPFVDSGRLRPLVMFSPKRVDAVPDVPVLVELGYNIAYSAFYCIVGPKGIPEDRIQILHDAFYQGTQEPGFKAVLKEFDMWSFHRDPQELKKYIEEFYENIGKVIKKFEIRN